MVYTYVVCEFDEIARHHSRFLVGRVQIERVGLEYIVGVVELLVLH